MNTPKSAVSWLERFPPDIWAYFAIYIPGEQLGRLMLTGATLLWQRLKSPTVVKSINLGEDFLRFKSWPMYLNDFRSLQSLSIHSYYDQWSREIGLRIDLIPSGVRKLELTGKCSKFAHTMFGDHGATLKLDDHLPHLESLDLRFGFANYSWMTHAPQSLTNLGIDRWDGMVELPRSLLHFTSREVALTARYLVSKLPTFLESFVVISEFRGVDLLGPMLPDSLRTLEPGGQIVVSAKPRNLIEQLPKSLTCLKIPGGVAKPGFPSLLPSTLTELEIAPKLPCSEWALLPKNLTKLSFRVPHLNTVVSKIVDKSEAYHEIPFYALPRSLTSLQLIPSNDDTIFCGPPHESDRSYFPPNLASLAIANAQFSPEITKLLPNSLTYLRIRNLCEGVCKHLPKGLRTLIAYATAPNFLPRSLTYLQLRLDPGHLECIEFSPLPPSLTFLHLSGANQLGDSFMLNQQFPNLQELHLDRFKHFTDLSIPLLPHDLKLLNFSFSSDSISGKSFEFLPRGLTYLKLDHSLSIFDPDIQQLPRTLKELFLDSAIHLTDLCVPDLPRHLESLGLRDNSKITPASFPHLPYPLRSCQLFRPVIFATWIVKRGKIVVN